MTDSKTVVEDLAAWLTSIWDEEERLAREASEEGTGIFRPHWSPVEIPFEGISLYSDNETGGYETAETRHIGAHDPASVLARIAADRKILALHAIGQDPCDAHDGVTMRSVACDTVRLLAEPNADKPGFRPEWLVERQGVEE